MFHGSTREADGAAGGQRLQCIACSVPTVLRLDRTASYPQCFQGEALARRSARSCLEPEGDASGSPTDPAGWDPRIGTATAHRRIALPLVPGDADTV